ncbi:MBL fold metallo-hydrolase [Chitinophaga sp. GCM10012297]|uniref:MBL fold metallo-hydrolase n=1 Tax=Chitinophaga chungangae TaxID=2821488 RepID=A0ABS3YB52_9BACT|nr:MBL fold metallo-hydrolase [Chitinophaga chungangae]MBO9151907.1 MBL fold metallo-hydrolase [Chitinophaga chungangae]
MKLVVIGSNSAGNSYLLQGENETLLIECGVHFSKIKKALGYNLQNVSAIVTHSHGDHSKSIKDVLNAGIPVWAGVETFKALGIESHHRAKTIVQGLSYKIGNFKVKPFNVNHDVPCLGFLIQHPECGLTLFLTDTYFCDYVFPGLNNIIVECNHAEDIISSNGTPRFLHDRIIQSHMNLETCKSLLKANDLSCVNNIVLIHLSDSNSDEKRFKREITELTGKEVHIATAGLSIKFNKTAI